MSRLVEHVHLLGVPRAPRCSDTRREPTDPFPGAIGLLLPLAHLVRVAHEQQPGVHDRPVQPHAVPPLTVDELAEVREPGAPLAAVEDFDGDLGVELAHATMLTRRLRVRAGDVAA